MKKVSIIVPVYNTSRYVEKCINSILNQTYKNIEVIIVEDYSTDCSRDIIKQYSSNPNVKIVLQPYNMGAGYARNIGINYALGEYISFIDSDDIISPYMIEKLVKILEKHEVGISICNYYSFFINPHKYDNTYFQSEKIVDLEQDKNFLLFSKGYCWNKLYKRNILDKIKFPEGIKFEDSAFTYPILIRAEKIAYTDEKLYNYRRNPNGITMLNKKAANSGIVDLYYTSEKLKNNYQLIRKNSTFDESINFLAHAYMYIGALDSLCWCNISNEDRKKIVNYFTYMADRKYDITYLENPVILNNMKRLTYILRIKLLEQLKNSDYYTYYSDKKILDEILEIVSKYNEKRCRIKR